MTKGSEMEIGWAIMALGAALTLGLISYRLSRIADSLETIAQSTVEPTKD